MSLHVVVLLAQLFKFLRGSEPFLNQKLQKKK